MASGRLMDTVIRDQGFYNPTLKLKVCAPTPTPSKQLVCLAAKADRRYHHAALKLHGYRAAGAALERRALHHSRRPSIRTIRGMRRP